MMRELTSSVSQGARLVLNVQVARTLLASCSSKETHTTTDFNHPPRSAGNEVSTWRCTLTNVCSPVWLLAPRRESQQRSGHARTSRGGIAASRARRNGTGRMPPSAHEASGLEDGVAREGQANTARATGERDLYCLREVTYCRRPPGGEAACSAAGVQGPPAQAERPPAVGCSLCWPPHWQGVVAACP